MAIDRSSSLARERQHVRCPACHYDLRAARGTTCPECGYEFQWHETRPDHWTPAVGLRMATRSLLLRSLIAIPVVPWLIYAGYLMQRERTGVRLRGRSAIAILLGLGFGFAFGHRFAERAGFVGWVLYVMLAIAATLVVVCGAASVTMLFPAVLDSANERRFWQATVVFGGSFVTGALIALWHDSE